MLLIVGYIFGSRNEKKHFQDLIEREKRLVLLPVRCDKHFDADTKDGFLVHGSVCVSADYFKVVVAGLRNFFGGNISVYESLLDRARREATIRMKEKAVKYGAAEVINFRIETSMINDKAQNSSVSVEIFAYGTAIRK